MNKRKRVEYSTLPGLSLKDEPHKNCIRCGRYLPFSAFGKHIHHKDGKDSRCIECVKHASNVVKKLRKTAGIKPKCCELCGREKPLVLDHCHKKGIFRGWLCKECNTAIGNLGDNIEGLLRAIEYLKRTSWDG